MPSSSHSVMGLTDQEVAELNLVSHAFERTITVLESMELKAERVCRELDRLREQYLAQMEFGHDEGSSYLLDRIDRLTAEEYRLRSSKQDLVFALSTELRLSLSNHCAESGVARYLLCTTWNDDEKVASRPSSRQPSTCATATTTVTEAELVVELTPCTSPPDSVDPELKCPSCTWHLNGLSPPLQSQMVCCDNCDSWYHFECVDYTSAETWYCSKCI